MQAFAPEAPPEPSALAPQPIPDHLIFVWFGQTLPDFARMSIRSALRHNPGARVSLFHDDSMSTLRARGEDGGLGDLAREPRLTLREIDVERSLQRVSEVAAAVPGPAVDTERLLWVWRALRAPAARSNLVRLLVLFTEGGIYLDTDTLTLRSLSALRSRSAFCGLEHILWPRQALRERRARAWVRGTALTGARFLLGLLPYGYRAHQQLLPWYHRAVNNAVLGFAPAHALLRRALSRITELDAREWTRRFRLGTHLLQEVLHERELAPTPGDDLALLSSEHFYPLGPVISRHYFRSYPDAAAIARELLGEQTFVVHWYASVSNLRPLGDDFVRQRADRVLFAHLCQRVLDADAS
jgi:hypothetical protein